MYGLYTTPQGISTTVTGGETIFTLLGFAGMYALLGLVFLYLLIRLIGEGPSAVDDSHGALPSGDGTTHALPERDVVGVK